MWCIPRSTVYHQKQARKGVPVKSKRGRKPVLSDEAVLSEIRSVIANTAELGFHGEGYRKVWAKLRFNGITADKERVYRQIAPPAPHTTRRADFPHRAVQPSFHNLATSWKLKCVYLSFACNMVLYFRPVSRPFWLLRPKVLRHIFIAYL